MPRFAANLSMLFTEVPFLDRFERAAKAGFQAFEGMTQSRRADALLQPRPPKISVLGDRQKMAEIQEVGAVDLHQPNMRPARRFINYDECVSRQPKGPEPFRA